jgi:WD40 repeat protein
VTIADECSRLVAKELIAYGQRGGWDHAEAYLKEHVAEHAAAAGVLSELLPQRDFLANADTSTLIPLLSVATSPATQALAVAYLESAEFLRARSSSTLRKQRLVIDQRRVGVINPTVTATGELWMPIWCGGGAVDAALTSAVRTLHGRITSLALSRIGSRTVAVIGGSNVRAGVGVWDLVTGQELSRLDPREIGQTRSIALTNIDDQPVAFIVDTENKIFAWNLSSSENSEFRRSSRPSVRGLAFGSIRNRKVVLTAEEDGAVRAWHPDPHSPQLLQEFTTRRSTGGATAVAFGSIFDVEIVVAGYEDGTVWAWDADSPDEPWAVHSHTARVNSLTFEATAKTAVVASGGDDEKVVVSYPFLPGSREYQDHDVTVFSGNFGAVRSVAVNLSSSPFSVFSGGDDGAVRSWRLSDRELLSASSGHHGAVTAVALNSRGVGVSGGDDGSIRSWKLPSNSPESELALPIAKVISMIGTVIAGESVVVTGHEDGSILSWHGRTGRHRDLLEREDRVISDLDLGVHSGRFTALIGYTEGRAYWWDLQTGYIRQVVECNCDELLHVRFQQVGYRPKAVIADRGGTIFLRDLSGSFIEDRKIVHHGGLLAIDFKVIDGIPMLASCGADSTVILWNLKSGTSRVLPLNAAPARAVRLKSVTGRPIVVVGHLDGTVAVWNAASDSVRTLHTAGSPVRAVSAYEHNGSSVIVSSSDDSSVRIWQSGSDKPAFTLPLPKPANSFFLDAGGRLFIGAENEVLALAPPRTFWSME